jgi:hypothetical protein
MSTVKTTGLPDVPPVADRIAEPPTEPEAGAVKEIVWAVSGLLGGDGGLLGGDGGLLGGNGTTSRERGAGVVTAVGVELSVAWTVKYEVP